MTQDQQWLASASLERSQVPGRRNTEGAFCCILCVYLQRKNKNSTWVLAPIETVHRCYCFRAPCKGQGQSQGLIFTKGISLAAGSQTLAWYSCKIKTTSIFNSCSQYSIALFLCSQGVGYLDSACFVLCTSMCTTHGQQCNRAFVIYYCLQLKIEIHSVK